MTPALILLIIWALGSYGLWTVMSRARGSMIDIGWRDRAVALFWLPLLVVTFVLSACVWLYDRGRCA